MSLPAVVQTEVLEFRSIGAVKGVVASPAFILPFQSTEDGSIFLSMLNPANPLDRSLYSLLGGKVQKFDLSMVPDLQDMQRLDYFPSDSMVAFLVVAINHSENTLGSASKTYGESKEVSTNPNKHQRFIVEFNRDGTYSKYIELPVDTPLFRLAVLPDGKFLITGYDPANDAQQLLLLDADGAVMRAIDQPLSKRERSGRRDTSSFERLSGGEASADLTTFVSYKNSVLAYRSGTTDPVLEISADGMVREVPIALPQGTVLSDMVASDDQWLIHVNTSIALSGSGPLNESGYSYYEVSPLDGSLLRKVTWPSGANIGSIACKSRGKYIAFSTDKDHKLIEFEANSR